MQSFRARVDLGAMAMMGCSTFPKTPASLLQKFILLLQIFPFVIIIIISCRRHGYPWPSLATSPYRSSPPCRSSRPHPVSSHSCCMYVRAGLPAFARPYVGVHRSTSLMRSSLLLQQWPACLVRLVWIVFVMGCRWPYSWCLVGCCRQDLFIIARNIHV